jgi:hypothetical protein
MNRVDILKKYFPSDITFACENLFKSKGINWEKLTDENADKVDEYLKGIVKVKKEDNE